MQDFNFSSSLGGATLRYVTNALNIQPTSPELHRNPSLVKLGFTHEENQQSKPHYQMVFDGQDDQQKTDVDNVPAELTSVPTEEHAIEEMQLDDTDSDFSSLNSQPSSLSHPTLDTQYSDDNEVAIPIDGEEREVNCNCQLSVEEAHKGENDVQVVTVVPVECQDKIIKPVVVVATNKTSKKLMDNVNNCIIIFITVQGTVDFEQPKQGQQDVAEVLYRSNV